MRVLIVGGSGYVGGIVLPVVAQQHSLRIFDRQPPDDPAWEYVAGSVGDLDALIGAATGVDTLIYMAMGDKNFETSEGITSNFDVNVKGVYLALLAAHRAGVPHAVYCSSMSVYNDIHQRHFASEDLPPDADEMYGLTKRLGEDVCRSAVRTWGISVNALRLWLPVTHDDWIARNKPGEPNPATAHDDLGRALLAALDYRDGFQAFMITGDYEQRITDLSKAKRLLGWEPLARPTPESATS